METTRVDANLRQTTLVHGDAQAVFADGTVKHQSYILALDSTKVKADSTNNVNLAKAFFIWVPNYLNVRSL